MALTGKTGKAITPDQRRRFFAVLKARGTVEYACEAAAISRTTAYRYKAQDKVFRELWETAIEAHKDVLLGEATRRAVEGDERIIETFDPRTGNLIRREVRRDYSDTLMGKLLEARLPAMFRRGLDLTIRPGSGATDPAQLTEAELLKIAAASPVLGGQADADHVAGEVEEEQYAMLPPGYSDADLSDAPLFEDDPDDPDIIEGELC